ncbi:MAG: PocR ligand-binding domain-containing protein [Anaerolineaceae bacterium]
MENFLTTKQVQNLLTIDRITVYRMLQDGRLKGIKIGNQWRFSQSEIDRLLNGFTVTNEIETDSVFPVHCVQTIQNLYSSVSKSNALVVDQSGKQITEISKNCDFCKLIQSSPSGLEACKSSWKSFVSQTSKNSSIFTCHAGLHYFGSVILNQKKVQGMFLSGQFRNEENNLDDDFERCKKLSKEHVLDLNALENAFKKVQTISHDQEEFLNDQPEAAASAVESILTERIAFVYRLQKIANLTQNL